MKGKTSRMFRELKPGERVAISINPSEPSSIPKRMQGKSGVITGKRGKAYIIKVKDYNESKSFIIKAIHLKKLK